TVVREHDAGELIEVLRHDPAGDGTPARGTVLRGHVAPAERVFEPRLAPDKRAAVGACGSPRRVCLAARARGHACGQRDSGESWASHPDALAAAVSASSSFSSRASLSSMSHPTSLVPTTERTSLMSASPGIDFRSFTRYDSSVGLPSLLTTSSSIHRLVN